MQILLQHLIDRVAFHVWTNPWWYLVKKCVMTSSIVLICQTNACAKEEFQICARGLRQKLYCWRHSNRKQIRRSLCNVSCSVLKTKL